MEMTVGGLNFGKAKDEEEAKKIIVKMEEHGTMGMKMP